MTSSESAPARWRPPEVVGPAAIAPTADELQALQRAAHEEAWAQGHQEGLAAGRAAAVERVARLDHLLAELAAPLAALLANGSAMDALQGAVRVWWDAALAALRRRLLEAAVEASGCPQSEAEVAEGCQT